VKTKELVVAGAVLTLVTYTLALSLGSQVFARAGVEKLPTKVTNTGIVGISGVCAYQDSGCNTILSSIDWGSLKPGSSKSFVGCIRNEGSSISTLSMSTNNWEPSEAQDYLALSWDYGGQSIDVDEVVQVTFTLGVDAGIEGIANFSFDIIIAGNT
jgi:hypothetical protein